MEELINIWHSGKFLVIRDLNSWALRWTVNNIFEKYQRIIYSTCYWRKSWENIRENVWWETKNLVPISNRMIDSLSGWLAWKFLGNEQICLWRSLSIVLEKVTTSEEFLKNFFFFSGISGNHERNSYGNLWRSSQGNPWKFSCRNSKKESLENSGEISGINFKKTLEEFLKIFL